jgi:hypothetical protein
MHSQAAAKLDTLSAHDMRWTNVNSPTLMSPGESRHGWTSDQNKVRVVHAYS